MNAVIAALPGVEAGATTQEIVDAINAAPADQLADIKALFPELASDADAAAIVAAITALQTETAEPEKADLKTEFLHEQAVVAGINAMDDANRPSLTMAVTPLLAVDYALKASVTGLKAADDGCSGCRYVGPGHADRDRRNDQHNGQGFRLLQQDGAGRRGVEQVLRHGDDRMVDGSPLPGMAAVASSQALDDADGDERDRSGRYSHLQVDFRMGRTNVEADAALFDAAALPSSDLQTYIYSE